MKVAEDRGADDRRPLRRPGQRGEGEHPGHAHLADPGQDAPGRRAAGRRDRDRGRHAADLQGAEDRLCHVHGGAASTSRQNTFRIINFDNPAPFFFRRGALSDCPSGPSGSSSGGSSSRRERSSAAISWDHQRRRAARGPGNRAQLRLGLGRDRPLPPAAASAPRPRRASGRAEGHRRDRPPLPRRPGDDATFLGITARRREAAIIFTGPPLDKSRDERVRPARALVQGPGHHLRGHDRRNRGPSPGRAGRDRPQDAPRRTFRRWAGSARSTW